MLHALSVCITIAILLVNLAGLSVSLARPLRSYALAKAAGPVLLAAGLFFVEHFVGLGGLHWLWPVTTACSLWLVWKERESARAWWRVEAAFAAAFAYPLAWRAAFPDISGSSEKIADLGFVANYMQGVTLPPVDGWFPPYPFTVYYGMQHYAAALLGRALNVDAGLAYNLGFCVVVGLAIFAAGSMAWLITRRRWAAFLVTAAFVAGGTGASLPVRWIKPNFTPWDSMRFIGGSATPEQAALPLGEWLTRAAGVPEKDALELPAETFGYLAQLGDFHPPLSGFLLLALALLAVALIERGEAETPAAVVLGLTVPLTICCDAWNLPLQAVLVAVWVAARPSCWRPVAAGAGAGLALMAPFLAGFGKSALNVASSFRFVEWGEHTPWLLGAILLYPFVGLAGLALLEGRAARWLGAFWLFGFLAAEIVFVDDVYSGKFNRFNTALKWWPYLAAGTVLSGGAWGLASRRRWLRALTCVPLLAVAVYAFDLAWAFAVASKPNVARLDGAAWLERDPGEGPMLEWLRTQPRGTVMELWTAPAFSNSCAIPLFSGHRSLLGWPAHEKLWRGWNPLVASREAEIRAFYEGRIPAPLRWLAANGVDHVLWLKGQNDPGAAPWRTIDERIGESYDWREFYRAGEFRVGLWSRRRAGDGGSARDYHLPMTALSPTAPQLITVSPASAR